MKNSWISKYKWDKTFFKMVCSIAIPIIFQQLVETFVGLADSVMISGYSAVGVSAVQIGSQWESIASLFSFGICSGVGIYTAQFIGSKDYVNLKKSFGTMIIMSLFVSVPFVLAALIFPQQICAFFIKDPDVIKNGAGYLMITSLSYVFIMISFSYNYTYRCMGKTKVAMYISSATVLLNCILNYILIYGKLGIPALGVSGAACATLFSRAAGSLMYFIYSKKTHQPFIGKFHEMFKLERDFIVPVFRRIAPTVANEAFFGIGQSLYFKAFGMLGAHAITSVAIADRISNLFFMVIWAITSAVQTIVGNQLGRRDFELAKKYANYFMGLGAVTSVILGLGMALGAPLFVEVLYPKEPTVVHNAATAIIMAYSIKICLRLFNSIIFGFLRCGGDTKILAMLDSVILYTVGIPLAFISIGVFHMNIVAAIFIVQIEQVVRIILAFKRYRSGAWIQNVTLDVE